MKCQNCGGDVQYPKLHRGRRYCSQQCREMAEKREQERERQRQHREYLVGDECNCMKCCAAPTA